MKKRRKPTNAVTKANILFSRGSASCFWFVTLDGKKSSSQFGGQSGHCLDGDRNASDDEERREEGLGKI